MKRHSTGKGTDYLAPLPADSFYLFDTYDYLDKLISFKLSDIFYAIFSEYYKRTNDIRALKMAQYFKYGTDNENEIWIRMTYWGLFIALTIIGIVNILMVNFKFEKGKKVITFLSVGLSIITVLYLAIAREPYAVTVAFLLLLIKGGLLYKRAMAGR